MEDQIINTRTSNQLPVEIIEEILCHLPSKSLLRFKCVSKLWRSLIASKQFIKRHLKKSNTNRKLAKLICDTTNDSLRSYCLRSLLDGNCTIATTLDHHPMGINWAHILRSSTELCYYDKEPVDYNKLPIDYPMIAAFDGGEKWAFHLRVLGSCNGLVLISINRKDLILWNPSTREAKNITPPSSYSFRKKPLYYVYGFGYDESRDDYKVVCIFSSLERRLTEIYSSTTDSWKKIENFDKIFMLYQQGMFVNGRLHWTTIKEGDGSRWDNIVSLDLVEEKFEIVAEPKNFSTNDYSRTTVEDLGGYLSLVTFGKKSDIDVWVMTKYGETESWTKTWTLAGIDEVNAIPYPVWLRENGDIAVCFGWDVVVYNGKNKLCKSRLDVFEFDITGNLYVESLVSPFGDEHIRRE